MRSSCSIMDAAQAPSPCPSWRWKKSARSCSTCGTGPKCRRSHATALGPCQKTGSGVVAPIGRVRREGMGRLVNTEPPSEALVERVARSMYNSEPGRFHWMVGIGAVDKTKQLSLYRDDWFEIAGLSADQFEGDDVARVLERCRLAVAVVGDKRVVRVGKAIFETGLVCQSSRSFIRQTRRRGVEAWGQACG